MRYTYADYVRDHQKVQKPVVEAAPEQIKEIKVPEVEAETPVLVEKENADITEGENQVITAAKEIKAKPQKAETPIKKPTHNQSNKKKKK